MGTIRRGAAAAVVALVATIGFVAAPAASHAGARQAVLADAIGDDSHDSRAGLQATNVGATNVSPENLARARAADCEGCTAAAVALQVVYLTGDVQSAGPKNVALAVNERCTSCRSLAYAWQYVVTTGGPVHVSAAGRDEMNRIRAEAQTVADQLRQLGPDEPIDPLVARLDDLAAQLHRVAVEEVRSSGQQHGTPAVSRRAVRA